MMGIRMVTGQRNGISDGDLLMDIPDWNFECKWRKACV